MKREMRNAERGTENAECETPMRGLLLPKEERRILRGHLWAYRNEFAELPDLADGAVVDVLSSAGRFVGRGFYQAQGGIAVRILSRRPAPIDAAFLSRRIAAAREFRERVFPGETVYRWLFGESDRLPGLVADRYGPCVSAQTSCAFYRQHREEIVKAFLECPGVEAVRLNVCGDVLRSGPIPAPIECAVDGVRVAVDIEGGQKTGMFLDQRENWRAAGRYADGAAVLDGHCYIGMWSIHAALAGAAQVLGVDTSAQAIALAQANAERNGVAERCTFERADIAEVLQRDVRYDLIILDPPALAKSHAQERRAQGLYHALNTAALKALAPGGILITSSCSHFVTREAFLEIVKRASTAAQRHMWLLEVRGAAPDHPVLMGMPETAYLNCLVLRAL
jgi:23S rRNA (cytosine1962-C5)-methyltransferase